MAKKTTGKKITAVVLAAGKSTRIKQEIPKVVTDLGGKPLIYHLLDTLRSLKPYVSDIVVVLGHKKEVIEPIIREAYPRVRFAYQKVLNGTAKAVAAACPSVACEHTLIVCADTPLITADTLKRFIGFYFKQKADGAVITSILHQENDFGRILRDEHGRVTGIIEKKDLGRRDLKEVNSGIYLFKSSLLAAGLKKIKMNPKKKEFYFTDIIDVFASSGRTVAGFVLEEWAEMLGVNDQQAMAEAYKMLNKRYLDKIMSEGVRVISPETTFLNSNLKIGHDCVIYPFTFIEKDVIIGNNCHMGPFVYLKENTILRDNTCIGGKAFWSFEKVKGAPFTGEKGAKTLKKGKKG